MKKNATALAYGVPFFTGLILQLFAIDLFRLTFVSTIISVGLYIIAGVIGFLVLRKKLIGHRRYNVLGIVISLTWCIVSFGGTLTCLFLATNFYLANGNTTRQSFRIEKTGEISTRYSSCVETYAIIKRADLIKEVIFKCDQLNKMADNKTKVYLGISKGALGFDIIRDKQLVDQ